MSHMRLHLFSASAVLAFAHPEKAATTVSNQSQPTAGLIGLMPVDYHGFAFVTGSPPDSSWHGFSIYRVHDAVLWC